MPGGKAKTANSTHTSNNVRLEIVQVRTGRNILASAYQPHIVRGQHGRIQLHSRRADLKDTEGFFSALPYGGTDNRLVDPEN